MHFKDPGERAAEEIQEIEFLKNPLPEPHRRSNVRMEFDIPEEGDDEFDLEIGSDDDFDI